MALSPIELLADYDSRALAGNLQLPRQEETRERWTGIGFRVAENVFVAKMGEVVEIVDVPHCTSVPGTKGWFMGLGNVRGTLLPVTDLVGFMKDSRSMTSVRQKVLVCVIDEQTVGFRVDDVLGLKHFFTEERSDNSVELSERVQPYVDYSYATPDSKDEWPVLDFEKLCLSTEFLDVSRHVIH